MNYREKMRKAVSSPWDGSAISYGEWGALRPEQRRLILRLLDEMDSADKYIKRLYLENEKLKEILKEHAPYFKGIAMTKEIDNLDISVFEEKVDE